MRVLLVDDHPLFRDALKIILAKIDSVSEVFEQESGQTALDFLEHDDDIDVILLDYQLGDMRGDNVLKVVKQNWPEVPVIMFSGSRDVPLIQRLFNLGAGGFITKNSTADLILYAIKLVMSGGIYIPQEMLVVSADNSVQEDLGNDVDVDDLASQQLLDVYSEERRAQPRFENKGVHLTNRQAEVLQAMGKGLPNKEIASALGLSPSTVKVHITAIMRELGVKNRTSAVSFAKDQGLIEY